MSELLLPGETLTTVNDGIRLLQNPEGLTYGTDAFLLASFLRRAPQSIGLEIGCGTGIISLLIAKRQKLRHIHAVEVQAYYAALAKRNTTLNGLDHRIEVSEADARSIRGIYDVVFMNPPYMKTDSGKRNRDDGKFAARHEVFGDIRELIAASARCLKSGGSYYAVYRPDRMMDLLAAMREHRIEPKRLCTVHADRFHKPSLLLVEGRRDGNSGCDYLRPLFLAEPDGSPTEEATRIYDSGDWIE
ncbi:MAG: methyltransferase domain-containing protein [Ruminococcaceae bacterium]|nr:methyltransferase domain-containing protein [Oscillospiraceae bacterium]